MFQALKAAPSRLGTSQHQTISFRNLLSIFLKMPSMWLSSSDTQQKSRIWSSDLGFFALLSQPILSLIKMTTQEVTTDINRSVQMETVYSSYVSSRLSSRLKRPLTCNPCGKHSVHYPDALADKSINGIKKCRNNVNISDLTLRYVLACVVPALKTVILLEMEPQTLSNQEVGQMRKWASLIWATFLQIEPGSTLQTWGM